MLYYSSRVKSVLTLNIAYFLTLFVRKCLDRANEKVKSLKIENFDETSKKRTFQIAENFDYTRWCPPLFRGLTLVRKRVFNDGGLNLTEILICSNNY